MIPLFDHSLELLQYTINDETHKNGHNEQVGHQLEYHEEPPVVESRVVIRKYEHVGEVYPVVVDDIHVQREDGRRHVVEVDVLVVLAERHPCLFLIHFWGLVVDSASEHVYADGREEEEEDREHSEERPQERHYLVEDPDCEGDLFELREVENESHELHHTERSPYLYPVDWDVLLVAVGEEEDGQRQNDRGTDQLTPHEVVL